MKDLPVDKGNNFDSKCWIVHSPNKNRGISRQVEVNMKWAGFVNSWLLSLRWCEQGISRDIAKPCGIPVGLLQYLRNSYILRPMFWVSACLLRRTILF